MTLADHEAETLLQAWGAYLRAEIEGEVGYPAVSASCAGYEAPDWQRPAPGPIRSGDVDRACWAMLMMSARSKWMYRDLRDHYRDNARMDSRVLRDGRREFARLWTMWERATQPANAC